MEFKYTLELNKMELILNSESETGTQWLISNKQIARKQKFSHSALNNQAQSELCKTLQIFHLVLVGLLLLSMIIICTIYISHLQEHVRRLDAELNYLKKASNKLLET